MQAFSDTNSTPAAGRNNIYKLPVEILMQIFLSAYLTTEHYIRFQLPFKLVLVTSFWRKLVLSEPRLWTYTFYGKGQFEPQPTPPIRSFLFQLSQSGSRPLEIAIDLRWRKPKKEFIDELIDALLLHKDRWASFALQTDYDNGTMVRIMRTIPEELPELRELVLQCQGGFDTGHFPGHLICPKLQVLGLRGTVLRHHALIASALPSLASVSIAGAYLQWNDWSTMLQRGPKLVELELRDVVIGRGDGVGSVPPVSIPHLKRLALRSLADRYASIETTTPDPIIASFFAPQLHTLRLDEGGTGTTPPPNYTWDKSMPVLKTLVIHNKGEIDANVFRRFPQISHVNVSDDRTEIHFHARRVLELLADPSTGPLLDKLDALTFSTMIPTYEGWEKFLSGKKLRVCIDSVFEIAARESMDTKNLQDREAAIEKLKAIVPVEICPIPKDNTWFSNRWRFGGDN